jgi:hypothetical protein
MKHINSISCGQGGPSLFLIVMAGEGMFPADVVIVADTGWENDMLWSNGERTTAEEFFERVTKPVAESYGMTAYFVRSRQDTGEDYPPIDIFITSKTLTGNLADSKNIEIPVFGSRGGRMKQTCTSKWKIQAIRQQLRRLGATSATTALGLHSGEAHRAKASFVKWDLPCWPLLDIMETPTGIASMGIGRVYGRQDIQTELERRSIPYLLSTECDGCPHKDWSRWKRTSPETIEELADFESQFNGEFFLTSARKPLKESLAIMEADNERGESLFDVCDSGYCFV